MPATRTLFSGGLVWDGTASAPARADVVIAEDRIVDIGSGLDGDHIVPTDGATLCPGFIDCHVHVTVTDLDPAARAQVPLTYRHYQAVVNLSRTLRGGVTTVRDAGGADAGLRLAVRNRLIAGPRLLIAVGMLSQTGGHGDGWSPSGPSTPLVLSAVETVVDGPDAVRRATRELIRAGAEVIKIAVSGGVLSPRTTPTHAHFRVPELEVVVEEADAAGIDVMAHAISATGIKNAVRAGIRSIEHGIYLDDEAIALLLEHDAYLVPTLVAPQGVIDAAEAGAALDESVVAKARAVVSAHRESFRRAVAAGVQIAMGTDSGVVPHGRNLREIELMAECGMPPLAALAAATSGAARLLRLEDEVGRIAPGLLADLVHITGDVSDVTDLPDRVSTVWQRGIEVS